VVEKNCFGHSSNEKSTYNCIKKNTENKGILFLMERQKTLKMEQCLPFQSPHPNPAIRVGNTSPKSVAHSG
jgi:hypothetical protein